MAAKPLIAQDLDMFFPEFFSLKSTTVGVGGGLAPDYEGSDEFDAFPIPQVRYNFPNACNINLLGPTLKVNVIPSRAFGFGPMLRYRPERDSVEDKVVAKFEKVDAAIEAGAYGDIIINNFILYTAFNKDISESHEGYLIDAAAGYRVGIESNVQLVMHAFGTYASEKYMETYFGVNRENSERSGLPIYAAESGLKDIGLMGALQYKINTNLCLVGIMKYSRLLGDAENSPIVEQRGDPNNFMDGIIINYNF